MSAFLRALAAFRVQPPEAVQASADARAARVLGPLDDLQRDFAETLARRHADGTFPDRRRHPRKEPSR